MPSRSPCWPISHPHAVTEQFAITLVVLGAGLARRFGSDKLAAELHGRPVSHSLLKAIAPLNFKQKLLVARRQPWTTAYAKAGFTVLDNPHPEDGPGSSLAVALATARNSALLVCLADMPFVTSGHLLRLVAAYDASPEVIASISGEYRGPPAIFPRHLLEAQDLARSGAQPLLTHAATIVAPWEDLRDIDTPEDLAELSIGSQPAATLRLKLTRT